MLAITSPGARLLELIRTAIRREEERTEIEKFPYLGTASELCELVHSFEHLRDSLRAHTKGSVLVAGQLLARECANNAPGIAKRLGHKKTMHFEIQDTAD